MPPGGVRQGIPIIGAPPGTKRMAEGRIGARIPEFGLVIAPGIGLDDDIAGGEGRVTPVNEFIEKDGTGPCLTAEEGGADVEFIAELAPGSVEPVLACAVAFEPFGTLPRVIVGLDVHCCVVLRLLVDWARDEDEGFDAPRGCAVD